MGCYFYVFQPVAGGIAVLVIRNYDCVGRNRVAGKHVVKGCGGLNLIRHDHGVHEARDGFAIDDGGLLLHVDRNYFAREGIALGDRGGAMTGGGEKGDEED